MRKHYRIGNIDQNPTEVYFEPFAYLMGRVCIPIDDLICVGAVPEDVIDEHIELMRADIKARWEKDGDRIVPIESGSLYGSDTE